jgi:hypothetical protein
MTQIQGISKGDTRSTTQIGAECGSSKGITNPGVWRATPKHTTARCWAMARFGTNNQNCIRCRNVDCCIFSSDMHQAKEGVNHTKQPHPKATMATVELVPLSNGCGRKFRDLHRLRCLPLPLPNTSLSDKSVLWCYWHTNI